MKNSIIAGAALALMSASSMAQVTLYGRVDLSIAQQADNVKDIEMRNGSGSRLGVRGVEDLGGGLSALFELQHRFNANNGTQTNSTIFWEGRSVVGLSSGFGTVVLGREENPAYTYGQIPADPWGGDTVASNGSIVNGRIGSTRYSNSVNYKGQLGDLRFGAQMTEGNGLPNRPYSLGASYGAGALTVGLGYENPGNKDDDWLTLSGGYDFGAFKLLGLIGNGTNANGEKHQAWLLSATAPVGAGELRFSYGELKNKDLDLIADKQLALGYHYMLSKRTTLYADVVNESRDALPSNFETTGWDFGVRHNF